MSACLLHPLQTRVRRGRHRLAGQWRSRAQELANVVPAALLLMLTAPLTAISVLLFGGRLRSQTRAGRWGNVWTEFTLVNRSGAPMPLVGTLPRLWNVMRGEIAWVGPEARANPALRSEAGRRIASVKPGLVCTWWIRQRTNIAYQPQVETDLEYVETRSARNDAGIAARALLALAYGGPKAECSPIAEILDLPLDNLTMAEAAESVLAPRPEAAVRQVSFINVDCVNKAHHDADYREILQTNDLRLADGIGLRIAGRLLKSEIRENVNGTDLFPVLCRLMAERGLSVYLLGAKPGVAEDVAGWIRRNHPKARVAGVQHGYFAADQEDAVVEAINASGADILLVAFGAPRQEQWIRRNRHRLAVRSALGVGGLFDFYSGRTPRAPQWLRELGLEWTYRLMQEPGRMWKRYLVGNLVFLARVVASKQELRAI